MWTSWSCNGNVGVDEEACPKLPLAGRTPQDMPSLLKRNCADPVGLTLVYTVSPPTPFLNNIVDRTSNISVPFVMGFV